MLLALSFCFVATTTPQQQTESAAKCTDFCAFFKINPDFHTEPDTPKPTQQEVQEAIARVNKSFGKK